MASGQLDNREDCYSCANDKNRFGGAGAIVQPLTIREEDSIIITREKILANKSQPEQ